jgi:hypothetical protein
MFVWLPHTQTLAAVIAGYEMEWLFLVVYAKCSFQII